MSLVRAKGDPLVQPTFFSLMPRRPVDSFPGLESARELELAREFELLQGLELTRDSEAALFTDS